jgi:predicted nuclease of predicted toxin-antitoxin system
MNKPIRIYADESVNVAIVEGLKRRGVKIWSARDVGKLGLRDEEQLEYAIKERAAIFTHDDDFLSLVTESGREHYGIIYVHQLHLSIGESIRRLKTLAETKSSDAMCNQIQFL